MNDQDRQLAMLLGNVVLDVVFNYFAQKSQAKEEIQKLIVSNVTKINQNSSMIEELVNQINGLASDDEILTVNQETSVSTKGADFIRSSEGTKKNNNGEHVVYKDSGGVLTAGYGSTYMDGELISTVLQEGDLISEGVAIKLFMQDVKMAEKAVIKVFNGIKMKQQQFDSLVSLAYNIGFGNFTRSESINKYKNDLDSMPKAIALFNEVDGKKIQGLVNRRKKEIDLFENGTYTS